MRQRIGTPEAEADASLSSVLASVRALIPPSSSLYYDCNRTRITEHAKRIAVLDLELTDLRKRAFAAGTKLLALAKSSVIPTGGSHDVTH